MSTESAEKESSLNQRIINGFLYKGQEKIDEKKKDIQDINEDINALQDYVQNVEEALCLLQKTVTILAPKVEQELDNEPRELLKDMASFQAAIQSDRQKIDLQKKYVQYLSEECLMKQVFLNLVFRASMENPQEVASTIKQEAKERKERQNLACMNNNCSEDALGDIETLFSSDAQQ
jgi:hypothetical protein